MTQVDHEGAFALMLVMGYTINTLTLLGIVLAGVSIWYMVRQRPPAHDVYATKPELEAMEVRLTANISCVANDRREATKELHLKITE